MAENGNPNGTSQNRGVGEPADAAALRQECERLSQRVADLEKENLQLKMDLGTFLGKCEIRDLDMDMVLRAAIDKPSLLDLINELKRTEG